MQWKFDFTVSDEDDDEEDGVNLDAVYKDFEVFIRVDHWLLDSWMIFRWNNGDAIVFQDESDEEDYVVEAEEEEDEFEYDEDEDEEGEQQQQQQQPGGKHRVFFFFNFQSIIHQTHWPNKWNFNVQNRPQPEARKENTKMA